MRLSIRFEIVSYLSVSVAENRGVIEWIGVGGGWGEIKYFDENFEN